MSALRQFLEAFFGPLDQLLGSLPLMTGRVAVALLLLVPLVWVLRLDREFILLGSPDRARWRDLRLWAVLVTLPYLAIYLFL
ncbi:MAG: hypothetical protein AAGA81_06105 [Acidobacteriota bacterium]